MIKYNHYHQTGEVLNDQDLVHQAAGVSSLGLIDLLSCLFPGEVLDSRGSQPDGGRSPRAPRDRRDRTAVEADPGEKDPVVLLEPVDHFLYMNNTIQ